MWLMIAGVVAIGAAAWGPVASNVEQARYETMASDGEIEIRSYAAMIVAETEVTGARKEAINQGFQRIADYIFGNNTPNQKVAMTAPVIQQPSETIAMTAPVTQEAVGTAWKIRFVMPAEYTMDTLPRPTTDTVTLKQVPGKRLAVIRFSGTADDAMLEQKTKALQNYLEKHQLTPRATPVYAFYNPPWTLPFLRRNEVMIEIAN